MATIIFYTKLGRRTAIKQITLLRDSGHSVDVRDLLRQSWRPVELQAFLADLPDQELFNPEAPRV